MFTAHTGRSARTALVLLAFSTLGVAASSPKVDVCHVTPPHVQLITVSSNAVKAHHAHGDHAPLTAYRDADGDGVGDAAAPRTGVCTVPAGHAATSGDCDDRNAAVTPGKAEIPGNGLDDDCDAATPDVLQRWDAAAEWGSATPNGVWTYGYVNAAGEWIDFAGFANWSGVDIRFREGPVWFQHGYVYGNPRDSVFGDCSDWCLQPHTIALHPPQDEPNQVTVRFTAPAAGRYRIQSTMTPIDAQANLVRAIVSGPAGEIASGDLTTMGTTLTVDREVQLGAGQSLLFSIDRADGWWNDATDLAAVITKVG